MAFRRFSTIFFLVFALCLPGLGRADDGVQALSQASQQNAALGYPSLSLYDLEKALQASPQDPELWRASARLMGSTGHPRLARERWLRVLDLAPGDPEATQAIQAIDNPPAVPTVDLPHNAQAPGMGLGLWMSGGGRAQVDAVNDYNNSTPENQHVRYLFALSGEWILDGAKSRWNLDLDQALIAADELGGDGAVYVWLNGSTQGAENLTAADWDRLAAELADQVQVQHHLGGVLLNPRCCGSELYPLEAALRRRLTVPLGVEVGAGDAEAFQYADFLVLRPVPVKGDPKAYADRVRDLTADFLATAQAVSGKAMVGVGGLGGPGQDALQGYINGRRAVAEGLPKVYDSFLGLAVWGLVADDEGVLHELGPDVWKQMKLPVEHP